MNNSIELTQVGRFDTGIFDEGAAEITAFDPDSQQLFVTNDATNTIDILDLSDPTNPTFTDAIDISDLGAGINSIAINDGVVAAAIEGEAADDLGTIFFFDIEGNILNQVTVGALPDAVTFTPDGSRLIVANEGEPDEDDPTINPEGSVSIIDISEGVENATVTTADFTAFNGQEDELRAEGVRIFPDETFANDIEPEFIAVSPDGSQAFVTLQENNAIAVVDLEMSEIVDIQPLGLQDFSVEGVGLDASDEDGGINIDNEPVFGLFQPDAIAAFEVDGETFTVTANEGDSRDEDERIEDLDLDPEAFPNAAELQLESELGRLEVSTIDGDPDGDGDFDQLVAFGGRSFSIRDAEGNLVFDSGDDFAQITAEQVPELFNSDGTIDSFDSRSDNSGAEPEGVAVGEVDGRQFAFVGLERTGGVIVYDISDPANSSFVQYINPIDAETGDAADLSPEGLQFISAEDSPNGIPLLTVANEISGTVTIFQIDDLDSDDSDEPQLIRGTSGDDILTDGSGNDTLEGLEGDDALDGGVGDNLIFGADGGDTLLGSDEGNLLQGQSGNNILDGGASNDTLFGGNQFDRLTGGDGDDLLDDVNGITIYNGSAGSNLFVINNDDLALTNLVQDFEVGIDTVGLVNGVTFEQLEITGSVNSFISLDGNEIGVLLEVNPDDLNSDSFFEI